MGIQQFASPIARYRGEKDASSQEFNVHFQSFAYRVSILCALHTGGKTPTFQTYRQLLILWEELQPYLSLVADTDNLSQIATTENSAFGSPVMLDCSINAERPHALDAD